MKKLLPALFVLLLLPTAASAQVVWSFSSVFPENADFQNSSVHGVAVDPDGKVWVQPFSATDSVQVPQANDEYRAVRVIYVFNADGSAADISPIKFVEFEGGARDTLGGFWNAGADPPTWEGNSGRGLTTDADGNIIVSQFNKLYKLDYQTGAGLGKAIVPDVCALTEAATDDAGNIYAAAVCPEQPIRIYDADLNLVGNAVDGVPGFSRDFAVSPDGNRIFWAGYTNSAVIEYARPDEFSPYDSVGAVIPGMDSEAMGFDPQGRLWVSAGSANDLPNDFEGFDTNWEIQTWYAFNLEDLVVDTVPMAQASIKWEIVGDDDGTGRPRGIAFSPDGMMAYVAQFNQPAPSVQAFSSDGAVAIERNDDIVPENFTLSQNYPNPFNPSTQINFTLNESGLAVLSVYDVLGRKVDELVNEELAAGSYNARFEAADLASGTYLYVLEFSGQRLTGKMLLLK